jgi:hypothetical protein
MSSARSVSDSASRSKIGNEVTNERSVHNVTFYRATPDTLQTYWTDLGVTRVSPSEAVGIPIDEEGRLESARPACDVVGAMVDKLGAG